MSGEYTPNSFEGFFTHSHDSGGDYSLAGNSDCFMVRWEPAEDKRIVVRTTEDAFSVEPWVARGIRCHASKCHFGNKIEDIWLLSAKIPIFCCNEQNLCEPHRKRDPIGAGGNSNVQTRKSILVQCPCFPYS